MSEYETRALDATTWDAFARLAEKHNGMGFGGCWCTWFHSREGRPEGEMGRPWKERLVREGKAHVARVLDGDAAVAWCQYALRKSFRASSTGRNGRPVSRVSRPRIASRASSSTGTFGGKASQPWPHSRFSRRSLLKGSPRCARRLRSSRDIPAHSRRRWSRPMFIRCAAAPRRNAAAHPARATAVQPTGAPPSALDVEPAIRLGAQARRRSGARPRIEGSPVRDRRGGFP
jgi:hypothetical protein